MHLERSAEISPLVRRVCVISSHAFSLSNFRGPLIREMSDHGIEVFALAPDYDERTRNAVRRLGASPIAYSLERAGKRPLQDILDFLNLAKIIRRLRVDMTFAYSIKPVIYGSCASRLVGVPRRFSMIAGLGYVYTSGSAKQGRDRVVLRTVISQMYRVALSTNTKVFFQNEDDRNIFVNSGIVQKQKAVLVSGTGVDLEYFRLTPPVIRPLVFLFIGRLLKEKGVLEYVEAARRVRQKNPDIRFLVVGGVDPNPGSVSESQIRHWHDEGVIEWRGEVSDVRPWIAQASVYVLPSYREGKPRSTQEAMAMGRPIITTDAPGCRDTVRDGLNGFLVRVGDPASLEAAMSRFIDQPNLIETMGKRSRELAEQQFDVDRINRLMLGEMGFEFFESADQST